MRFSSVIIVAVVAGCHGSAPLPAADTARFQVLGRGFFDWHDELPFDHVNFANRVLIIRDPAVLDAVSYDPYPTPAVGKLSNAASFKTLMKKAGATDAFDAGAYDWKFPEGDLTLKNMWIACANDKLCLDTAPFRLLAIVLRPDLANYRCGQETEGANVCGAELRFEFALIQKSGAVIPAVSSSQGKRPVQIILEFAIQSQSKQEFQTMLHDWRLLANLDNAGTLAVAWDQTWSKYKDRFGSAKLRASAKMGPTWNVTQYSFVAGGLTLADQLPGEIARSQWINDCEITPAAKHFLQQSQQQPIDIPSSLLESRVPAPLLSDRLEIGPDYKVDQRFYFALNSCSGCHSWKENRTYESLHVSPRGRSQASKLSPFLTGSEPAGEPTNSFLPIEDSKACQPQTIQRLFNDLVRRHRYMDAVLNFNPSDTNWTETLRTLKVSFDSVH
jgi:hypothetical protein